MANDSPSEDLIRYDVMVQDALLGVVRKVLIDASRKGLPGEHHFYISFRSHAPGVKLSARLKEKYPDEMTIVIQHQFWDLLVTDQAFEVGLSFRGISERLYIPFDALTGFYDPSVQFGLKFAAEEAQADNDAVDADDPSVKARLNLITEHERARKGQDRADSATDQPGNSEGGDRKSADAKLKSRKSKSSDIAALPGSEDQPDAGATKKSRAPRPKASETKPTNAAVDHSGSGDVVSLDAFRKKK